MKYISTKILIISSLVTSLSLTALFLVMTFDDDGTAKQYNLVKKSNSLQGSGLIDNDGKMSDTVYLHFGNGTSIPIDCSKYDWQYNWWQNSTHYSCNGKVVKVWDEQS